MTEQTPISENEPFGENITERGLRALEVYQRQQEIANRLWSYFSLYTAGLILVSLAVVAFRGYPEVWALPWYAVAIPPAAYMFFCVGNHLTLRLVLKELFLLRAVATATTRLTLRTPQQGRTLLFHVALAGASIATYGYSWYLAYEFVHAFR